MKNPLITATLNLSLAMSPVNGQQSTPTVPIPAKTGCAAVVVPSPPKGWHFKIPAKVQQAIDKQRQQFENRTGVSTPSTDNLKQQVEQPKPCPVAPPILPPKTQQ